MLKLYPGYSLVADKSVALPTPFTFTLSLRG